MSEPAGLLFPKDLHNQRLEAHVRPPDWVNPKPLEAYNIAVIGAGSAGLAASSVAAELGAKVALIERNLMGGECLNAGSVPSKGILSAARRAAAVRRAGEYGIEVPAGMKVDFAKVMERMRSLRADISVHDSARRYRELGIDVFRGRASFTGTDTMLVGEQSIRFKLALIATGARAAVPPIPGVEETPYLTNETVFSLTELPERFGIVGAGPAGCEMAQSFARLGSKVFLIVDKSGVLPREDREAAAVIHKELEKDGVEIVGGGEDLRLSPGPGGTSKLQVPARGKKRIIEVDRLLLAVGRTPNVEGLDLVKAKVQYDETGVKVNRRFQTTNRNIFAAGDVCSNFKFTHAADITARVAVQNALFFRRTRESSLTIPWCTYTEPEIAHIGHTAESAARAGILAKTLTLPMAEVHRAVMDGDTAGFVRVHFKAGSGKILGATIVAGNAGDIISQFSMAMKHGIRMKKLGASISPYPTQAEAVKRMGDLYNRARLTSGVRTLAERFMAWRRR